MNIVKPYATLMDVPDRDAGVALLKKIEWCGRISHRSEDAQTGDSWDRFIRTVVLGHGDLRVGFLRRAHDEEVPPVSKIAGDDDAGCERDQAR